MEQRELQTANTDRGLPELVERREVRIAGIRVAGRRQPPSGGTAPSQREPRTTGRLGVLGSIAMVAIWISLFAFPETTDWRTDRDNPILERFVDFRNSPLTSFSDRDAVVGSPWSFRVLRIRTLVARIPARRIRHLVAVLPAIILVGVKVDGLQIVAGRPRPFVPTIGDIG